MSFISIEKKKHDFSDWGFSRVSYIYICEYICVYMYYMHISLSIYVYIYIYVEMYSYIYEYHGTMFKPLLS